MTTRYHYDANGRYRGRSLSDADLALELVVLVVAVPAALFFLLRWIYHGLLGYANLAIPYKWFVGSVAFLELGAGRWRSLSGHWRSFSSAILVPGCLRLEP